jgi:hypothetical protein
MLYAVCAVKRFFIFENKTQPMRQRTVFFGVLRLNTPQKDEEISASPDKIHQGRLFSSCNAQRDRLGPTC